VIEIYYLKKKDICVEIVRISIVYELIGGESERRFGSYDL